MKEIDYTGNGCDAQIAKISKLTKSYHTELHRSAVIVCLHGIEHGEPTYALKLLKALESAAGYGDKVNALRLNALRQWFVGPSSPFKVVEAIEVNENGKEKITKILVNDKPKRDALLAQLKADKAKFIGMMMMTPFYQTAKKEKEDWDGFDFDADLMKLFAKAKRMAEKHKGDPNLNLGKLEAIMGAFYMEESATTH